MLLAGLIKGPGGLDPLILLLFALILDALIGPWFSARRLAWHPLNLFAAVVRWCDRKMNRAHRSAADRAMRGAVMVLVLASFAGALGYGIAILARHVPEGFLLELLAILFLIDQRAVHEQVRRVAAALSTESLGDARARLQTLSGSGAADMDSHAIARTAIQIAARSFAFGVVAPAFWYVLFGLPGLMVLRAVAVIDDVVGEPSDKHRAFGFVAARLDEVLILIPAPIAGLLLVIASLFVPTARPGGALKTMTSRAAGARTLRWPVGAMAGALDVALAGGSGWIGTGSARARALDIRRALFLFTVGCLLDGVTVAALAVAHLV
jgi:adenosylcobinamide-phosphate synthase